LYDNIPARSGHRFAPQLSGTYQELFDVFGGKRNLGVSLNVFYNENVNGTYTVTQDYAFVTTSPAYVWDYRNFDQFFNRRQRSANLKVEYKLSDHATVVVNTLYNEPSTIFDHRRTMRAFTGRTLATIGANGQPTGTGAIMPGYTDDFTEVRNVPASTVQLNASLFDFLVQERKFDVGLRHEYDRWSLDYDLGWNYSHPVLGNSRRGNPGGGVFTMDVMNVGWTLDKSRSDDFPAFTQTAGASIFEGASYGNGLFVTRDNDRFTDNINASLNFRYDFPALFNAAFKAGARYRSHEVEEIGRDQRWNWAGGSLEALTDPNGRTSFGERLGRELPFPSPAFIGTHIRDNPAAWREDLYFREMSRLSLTRDAAENISAGYVSGEARFRALSVVGGVRVERTEIESNGFVGSRLRTTTAQRNADPIGSAQADFDNPRHLEGSYTDWFPGLHLKYRGGSRWQARLSWSNSVGRPTLTNYLPLETPNTTNETLRVNNPSLKPQYTENFDATIEYYFEPVGLFSLGVFRKNIDSYIVSNNAGIVGTGTNNGYNGNYEGYTLISQFNGGWAEINGFEANYQQQLSFLPGIFKGFGVFANYTKLKAEGNFGGEAVQSTNELADFMPEAMNAGISYRYRGFNARVRMNYAGSFLTDYSADASRLRYRAERTAVNGSVSYQWRNGLQVFCDVFNIFNEPQEFYRFSPDRLGSKIFPETTITFGVTGKF
jgi:TonB-dependent receptor